MGMSKQMRNDLVDVNKPKPKFAVQQWFDDIGRGHRVLVLPAAHPELNPIELVWSDMKTYVAHRNTEFSMKRVKELAEERLSMIDVFRWGKYCDHVDKIASKYWEAGETNADPTAESTHENPQ